MWGLILTSVLLLGQATLASPADRCTCKDPHKAGGWCRIHEVGYVGDVTIRSAWLFDAVDPYGHDVDLTMVPISCAACQRAIAEDGYCRQHKWGFVHQRAYFSLITHHLAKGAVPSASALQCSRCRTNGKGHGWCDRHRVGMIGSVALHNRQEYDEAVAAADVLREASKVASRCDRCAVALITGTQCPYIVMKDGKPFHRDPATIPGAPKQSAAAR